jgi:hypothetical protein
MGEPTQFSVYHLSLIATDGLENSVSAKVAGQTNKKTGLHLLTNMHLTQYVLSGTNHASLKVEIQRPRC